MPSLPDLGRAFADLAEVFGQGPQGRGFDLYAQALADLSAADLGGAVAVLIRDHPRFFPTPAEIRAAAVKARVEPRALPAPADPWPEWLAAIWGPAPEGPKNRAAALGAVAGMVPP